MRNRPVLISSLCLAAIAAASPALARPTGWERGGWERGGWGAPGWGTSMPSRASARRGEPDRSREGRIEVDRFVGEGDAAAALGQGPITVASQSGDDDYIPSENRAVFEAAVVDRLVHAGYDTAQTQPDGGQVAELRVLRTQLDAGGAPRKPVSGTAAMEVGNRGSAYGLAVNVDLTKPLPPLVSTRLEARIRDRATGKLLWEGRASIARRSGDAQWTDQTIAARLAEALFDDFPRAANRLAPADPG